MADKRRVLVPARMLQHLKDRVEQKFDVIYVEDFEALDDDARNADAIAGWGKIDAKLIDSMPNLKIIAGYGVGYDSIDANHAAKKGVMVTHTPDVLSGEVADTTIGLLLNTVREFPWAEQHLRNGDWPKKGPYRLTPLTLRGRKAGIFGLGRIGLEIAKRLEPFGVSVAYTARSKKDVDYPYYASLKELAEAVDTLIVAAPGTPETENAVNTDVLKALGSNGVLINIGRGSVVDEPALIEALKNGTIAAAGLDVFADEPNVPDELIALPNASLLPHVASASVATRDAMADLCADNLEAWFETGRAVTAVPECRGLNGK